MRCTSARSRNVLAFTIQKRMNFPMPLASILCSHLRQLALGRPLTYYLTISVNNLSLHLSTTELLRHLSLYERWIPQGILQLLGYKNDLITFNTHCQKPKHSQSGTEFKVNYHLIVSSIEKNIGKF